MLTVTHISTPTDLEHAFAIRREVFVEEQHVPADEEYDDFETRSHHFLAWLNNQPVGTARWRKTRSGVKLERFAVRAEARGKGVGKALVQRVLLDVFGLEPGLLSPHSTASVYMHAQVSAMPLYAGFGFVPVGDMFEECGIQHYTMVLPVSAYPPRPY